MGLSAACCLLLPSGTAQLWEVCGDTSLERWKRGPLRFWQFINAGCHLGLSDLIPPPPERNQN